MKERILKILLGLWLLNATTYWLFSETSSHEIVNNKYLDITQRRLENTWNVDTSEHVIVASCGDEFFRYIKLFESTVCESNPKHKEYPNKLHTDSDFYQTIWKVDDDLDVLLTIREQTVTLKLRNCVIYKVCSMRTIPAFMKRIEYQYYYSDSPTDYHIMFHNGKMETSTPTYFWLFGFWIEIGGQITSLN